MKYFILLTFFILSSAYGATCTTTSRTNYSTGQVLTSSALNADLNQLVTKVNGLDGGCVTDGTLEAAALNSTDFAAVTNGIHQGCALSYSDANTLSVDKCILSVNGAFVKTSTASTVTWLCSGCAAEAASTQYYVYAKTGSTGTTLNLLISTTAPNGDGYDGSGNKILGEFYNNASSAIEITSIMDWKSTGFLRKSVDVFTFSYGDGATTVCATNPCTYLDQYGQYITSVTRFATGVYPVTLSKTYTSIKCTGAVSRAASMGLFVPINSTGSVSSITINSFAVDGTTTADTYGTVHCEGY